MKRVEMIARGAVRVARDAWHGNTSGLTLDGVEDREPIGRLAAVLLDQALGREIGHGVHGTTGDQLAEIGSK